jgi:TolB-like protein
MPDHPEPEPDDAERQRKKDRKARKKIRSAWIGFVGRILAQVIGAAATVALGLMIAHRVHRAELPEAPSSATRATPVQAARPRTGAVSIAVLPLDNYSGEPGQEYFADGMTEALIADLARIRALRVISRTSAMQYKNAHKPLPQIALELGVDVVIEGSVALAGRRVRVTAQLVDAHADRQLWAESYERELEDVLALQSEVARSVAREVEAVLSLQEQTRLARSRPVDDPAVMRTGRDPQLEKAIDVVLGLLETNPPPTFKRPPYPDYKQRLPKTP